MLSQVKTIKANFDFTNTMYCLIFSHLNNNGRLDMLVWAYLDTNLIKQYVVITLTVYGTPILLNIFQKSTK